MDSWLLDDIKKKTNNIKRNLDVRIDVENDIQESMLFEKSNSPTVQDKHSCKIDLTFDNIVHVILLTPK